MDYKTIIKIINDSSKISEKQTINRDEYFNWLKKNLNNNFIKVISGFRRVGKSFLLKQLKEYLIKEKNIPPENIFFINFEHYLLASKNSVQTLNQMFEEFFAHSSPKHKKYLFLDEIQNVLYWEKFARTLYDSGKNEYQFFLTGSNSALLSSEFSTALGGRTVEKQVYPFSFTEYLKMARLEIKNDFEKAEKEDILKKHLLKYLQFGALPELFGKSKSEIEAYIESLFKKVLLDDIIKRFKIEKVFVIEQLLYFIFASVGSLFSFRKTARRLQAIGEKVSVPTIQQYTHYYEESFAINKVKKFEWRTKKVFHKNYKFYAVDNAFLSVLNISKMKNIQEKLLENLVFNKLRKKHKEIYYGRDNDGKEIDFIIPQNNKYLKIQVTLELNEENKKRELGNFFILDKYLSKGENCLITLFGENKIHKYKNTKIKQIPLLDFLLR